MQPLTPPNFNPSKNFLVNSLDHPHGKFAYANYSRTVVSKQIAQMTTEAAPTFSEFLRDAV